MNKTFLLNDILALEQRTRVALINSLGGFKSIVLIGTRSAEGITNLAIFNSLFHLGANPALFGFIVRPDTVERHTLSNILVNNEFTVNHIHEGIYVQAHQTSARYPREISEFQATGLSEEYIDVCSAPFVKESRIKIGASLVQKIDILENGTILIIAKIQFISLPEDCLGQDGFIDLEKAGTLAGTGLDSYHKTNRIARLSYAKPDKSPEKIL